MINGCIVYDNIIISHVIIIDNIIMTYKKRFRKTKNHRSFRGNNTYKKRRMHKTTLKKGGTATATQIFNTISAQGVSMTDQQKNEILSSIDTFIKSNNVHAQDTGIIGRKTNALMESVTSGLDGSIEVIGKWLIPGKSSVGKKNMSEIIVYFFPSLVKSKPGDNNKPKLRHGSIMVKTNNQFTDITHFVRSMTRDTDDMIAEMTRGATYPLGRKPYHTERFRISERLDGEWNYNPKGDAAINLMAEKTVNNLKAELAAKKAELDKQKKELKTAMENKDLHEKSTKNLKADLEKINAELKKNKGNESVIAKLNEEKEKIKTELATAKTDLETSKTSIKKGNADLESTKKVLEAANLEVDLKNKENKDLKRNLGKLQKDKDDLIKEKIKADLQVNKLKKELKYKENLSKNINTEFESLKSERNKLNLELNTARSDSTLSKEEIAIIQSELTKKNEELEQAQKMKKQSEKNDEQVRVQLEKALNEAKDKDAALLAIQTDLIEINKTQSQTYATNAAEIEILRSKLHKEESEKVQKEKQLAAEKAQKEKLATEKAQKEKELENKQRELEITNKALSDKESEFQRQQKEIQEYQTDKTAFQDSERSIIKYNIIADKIRLRLSTPPLNKITHSANPIPPAVIDEIKKDITENDALKTTWVSQTYDIDVKLTSIAKKLATETKYQKKYIALFSKSSASSG